MQTKADLLQWLKQMVPGDLKYLDQSGAAYLPEIRELEAILRPLWAILPAYFSGEPLTTSEQFYLNELKRRVETGDLPAITTHNRQIAVELGVIAYALGTYRERFLNLFSAKGQKQFAAWLNTINDIEFPAGNWYFFLALINAALRRNHLPYSKEKLTDALDKIETFYIGNNWYTDGPNEQSDYYIAFAFHFYGMIYASFVDDDAAQLFRQRALGFAHDFQYWFDDQGRSLPFGRSLTYRFAHVSFWSAMVTTGLYRDSDFSLGQIKGIILRNFRFWQKQPIVVPAEHNLSIGYGYAQQVMAEDYNAPGSPMWAFKSLILLGLPADHAFWQVKEASLEKWQHVAETGPGFLIDHDDQQVTALSARQYANSPQLYRGTEKYSKFAYSTYFGFNVSRGQSGLSQFAIDSTLAFSIPGHDQYATRHVVDDAAVFSDYAVTKWRVWHDIQVVSYLIPVAANCHVRLHEIDTPYAVMTAEGGFPLANWNHKYNQSRISETVCVAYSDHGQSLIKSLAGTRQPLLVPQGPNTNLYSPEKNAIPVLTATLTAGQHVLGCLVFGDPNTKKQIAEVSLTMSDKAFELKMPGRLVTISRETPLKRRRKN
ncbi:DUF2264 domain-containing protein [Lacticaseibacillus chiayiensis]|uniref:DUF2264 domain-containing protein n=1 Tax=Lacticaseibacillus chiayiensis TaxID=2100821 RepID=UPI003C70A025